MRHDVPGRDGTSVVLITGAPAGPARPQSEVSKELSRLKLEVKIAVLNRWAERGVPWQTDAAGKPVFDERGERLLEHYPRSQNQARIWKETDNGSGLQVTLDELLAEGRITREQRHLFTSYKSDIFSDKSRSSADRAVFGRLQQSLKDALRDVHRQAVGQLETSNKASVIDALREQAQRLERMLQDTATNYLNALVERDKARRQAAQSKRKRDSLAALVAERDSRIAELEAHVGELTRTLSKVVPLKEAPHAEDE